MDAFDAALVRDAGIDPADVTSIERECIPDGEEGGFQKWKAGTPFAILKSGERKPLALSARDIGAQP